jgi:hypothetical protein
MLIRRATKPNNDNIQVVRCGSGDASLTVVGKVENKSQAEVILNSAAICKPFPTRPRTRTGKARSARPGTSFASLRRDWSAV